MYKYKITKNLDDAMTNFAKKDKMVDEVADMSKRMKLKHQSLPDNNHFGKSMSVDRVVKTSMPTKSSMVGRKNLAFASLVD